MTPTSVDIEKSIKPRRGRPCVNESKPNRATRAKMRIVNGENQKKCSSCGLWLSENQFRAHRVTSAGGAIYYRPLGWCIDCDRVKRRRRIDNYPRVPTKEQLTEAEPIFRSSLAADKNGCLIFNGVKHAAGYGFMTIGKRLWLAHHLSLFYFKGIPLDYYDIKLRVVDHLCMNKACANPEHLEVVTALENFRRARVAKSNKPNSLSRHLKKARP